MRVEELVPVPDPVLSAERLEGLGHLIFFDSAARGERLGRYSFLTADPAVLVRSKGSRTECLDLSAPAPSLRWQTASGDALSVVGSCLRPQVVEPAAGLPPFQGGAAGYLAYEWGRTLEPRLQAPRYDDLRLPDALFGIYDWVLAWDHELGRCWLISTGMPETSPRPRKLRAGERARRVLRRLAGESEELPPFVIVDGDAGASPPSFPVEADWREPSSLGLRSSFTHEAYLDAVARVREYILAGDIFQSNLSQRFEAPLHEEPWTLYRRLRDRNAAPFAAYFDAGSFSILSASPERFLRASVDGQVETRPIKGTRARGVGPEHDAALGQALTESAKDRAENLMIVDLMRNDLSRVCVPGTVHVEELFTLEHYASVHHLVSTVAGKLATGTDASDLLRASFPGGSITGAPKIRAMEIITELEPCARGVYCGAMGYWSVTGALDMNIAIRTTVAKEGRVYFNAGGGIVVDSDPEREYRETLDKARGIIDSLAAQG